MSTRPISKPLPGERVVALTPSDLASASATWLRRPNLFPGRALTAPTLEGRSAWVAGRVAQRGQSFTSGVVRGLGVGHVTGPLVGSESRPSVRLLVEPGQGLTVLGEDVMVARGMDADLWSLPVVAPPAVLAGEGFGAGGVLQPRVIGASLGAFLDVHPGPLPPAAILVLQPVGVEEATFDPHDPCGRGGCDEGDVAFEDWRVADAARLLWYVWPEDWRPAPLPGPLLRNRLAWITFDAEEALSTGASLPWEEFGVPLALLGLDGDHVPTFLDQAAVVRRGGLPRAGRLSLSAESGLRVDGRLPTLWQARIEQLAEQVAEMGDPAPPPSDLAGAFDRLPPCGLLPRNVIDLDAGTSEFFPESADVDAVPIPMEQLDLALRESAGLGALDMARGERVRILVPVSQASYEARLLMSETIDPDFRATLDRFLVDRGRALAGRQAIRIKSSVLLRSLRGDAPPVPPVGEDREAVEPETLAPWGPPAANGGHRTPVAQGTHAHGFAEASDTLAPGGRMLYVWVCLDPERPPRSLMLEWRSGRAERRAYWGENLIDRGTEGRVTRLRMGDLPPMGRWLRLDVPAAKLELDERALDGVSFLVQDGRAAFGPAGHVDSDGEHPWFDAELPEGAVLSEGQPFEFLTRTELMAPFEPRLGVVPAAENDKVPHGVSARMASLADDPRLAGLLSDAERGQLEARGVEGFIDYLTSRADRADDLIDYGFLKVQTDIYRIRQLVLGSTDATRLAVSPTLAGIAQAETAVASRENLAAFFDKLRKGEADTKLGTTDGGGGGGPRDAADTASASGASGVAFGGLAPSALHVSGTTAPALEFGGVTSPAPDLVSFEGTAPRVGSAVDDNLKALLDTQTLATPLGGKTTYTPSDITNAQPLVGSYDLRTISVAERLQEPKAKKARDYTTVTRHESVLGLVRLADQLTAEDGEIPGLFDGIDVWALADDDPIVSGREGLRRPLTDFISGDQRPMLLAALLNPPVREGADEASHFSDGADLADRTVALLRQVEGRVKRYRGAIAACEEARDVLRRDLLALGQRERIWITALAEARHDVAVTRALTEEEETRLDAINTRRAKILAEEVRFVAFVRPRTTDNLASAAARPLDPGLLPVPAPACFRAHPERPEALRAVLEAVREAPAGWFRLKHSLLDGLDRVELLVDAVRATQARTRLFQPRPGTPKSVATGVSGAIETVRRAQAEGLLARRAAALQVDLSRFSGLSWKGARSEAEKIVSLGDLMEGTHGRPAVARDAAAFFHRVADVSACLHAGFSHVVPSIRLDWAETLSQFDESPRLRNLSGLARWPEIDVEDRRNLQGLVDWLFDQVELKEGRAQALVNDVVRMCILLASHAPVGRILAGRLPRPVVARPGFMIPLVPFDPSKLRVGMHAVVYRGDRIVARAQIEDMGGAEASARVTHTSAAEVELDETVRVHFVETAALRLNVAVGAMERQV